MRRSGQPGDLILSDNTQRTEEVGISLEAIVERYSERVFNLTLRILHNREDAEEATQDTFMRVFKSLGSFKGQSSLSTWIYRIGINVCFDYRKKNRTDVSSLDEMRFDPPDGTIENQSHHEKSLYDRENTETINRSISLLPPNESAIITMFYLEGLSYQEISELMKMPIGTVSIELHRGRKRLAEMLRKKKDDL